MPRNKRKRSEKINLVPAKETNSMRDVVKDAIHQHLVGRAFMEPDELTADIADSVFGAMGITDDMQDAPVNEIKIERLRYFRDGEEA